MAKKKAKKSGSERRFESFMELLGAVTPPDSVTITLKGNDHYQREEVKAIAVREGSDGSDGTLRVIDEGSGWAKDTPVINDLTLQDGRIVRGK